eukprot:2090675-Pleurochrysis_carterae.AAC.1
MPTADLTSLLPRAKMRMRAPYVYMPKCMGHVSYGGEKFMQGVDARDFSSEVDTVHSIIVIYSLRKNSPTRDSDIWLGAPPILIAA